MSIMIKGMKMPKSCIKCPFCGLAGIHMERLLCMFTGKSEVRELIDDRLPGCPVVALPEKHRRLIEEPESLSYAGLIFIHQNDFYGTAEYFAKQIEELPTIIEAEGEKWPEKK